jgi:SAM-dependent methyltransferase
MLEFGHIDGWFNFSKLYSEMVINAKNNSTFVELGVFKGASAAHMAKTIYKENKDIKFFAIDWFKGSVEHSPDNFEGHTDVENWLYNHCLNNLKPAIQRGLVNVIKMNVKDAANMFEDESIDFCFHDASHEYEDLIVELPLWWNKIKPGGYFGGHDYGNWGFIGVSRAVNKLAEQYDLHVTYRASEDSWLIQKPH